MKIKERVEDYFLNLKNKIISFKNTKIEKEITNYENFVDTILVEEKDNNNHKEVNNILRKNIKKEKNKTSLLKEEVIQLFKNELKNKDFKAFLKHKENLLKEGNLKKILLKYYIIKVKQTTSPNFIIYYLNNIRTLNK